MKKLLLMSIQFAALIIPSLAALESNAMRGAKRAAMLVVAYNFIYIFVVMVVWMSLD